MYRYNKLLIKSLKLYKCKWYLTFMQKESTVDILKIMSPASRKNKANDELMTELAELSLEEELLRQNLPGNLIGKGNKNVFFSNHQIAL